MNARIGDVFLTHPTVLAPLAGITNLPFRILARQWGCGLVCSEMISANGLVHGSRKTCAMLMSAPAEKPLSVQIFGANPDVMADAARMVADSGADILDINFGCSVKKVIKTGSGAALMQTPDTAAAILRRVRQAVSIPLTIKIRSGWDESGQQAIRIAQIAGDCGVDAIAVHPRTAVQGFRGHSDWSVIRRIKVAVSIPVIGNGDIQTPDDALRMFDETGCDMVMIGRAAIGFPWIFSQIAARIAGQDHAPITLDDRFDAMMRYVRDSVRHIGEPLACRMLRSRLCWFVRGLPHGTPFRQSITRLETAEAFLARIAEFRGQLIQIPDLKCEPVFDTDSSLKIRSGHQPPLARETEMEFNQMHAPG